MLEVEEQLRRYGAALETELLRQNEAPVADVPALHVPASEVPRTRRHRGLLVGSAAVVAAVVVALVVRAGDDHKGSRGVQINPAVTPEQLQAGWERIPNGIEAYTFVNDAASGASSFVAVGYGYVPEGSITDPTTPAIWRSSDGASWTRVPPETHPPGITAMNAIAYWRDEFWALGTGPEGIEALSSSDGGQTWKQQSSAQPSLSANRLLADSLGLIAYGDGAAFSSNGHDWQRSNLVGFVEAVARQDSALVALVRAPVGPGSGRAVIYVSNDATHWTRAADLGPTVDPGGSTLTVWKHELWAATYPGTVEKTSALWRSVDGANWSRAAGPAPSDTTFDTLTRVGDYLVATGFDTDSRPGGWVTTDGSTWISMPDLGRPPFGRLNIAASDDRALIALSTSELRDAYLWRAPTR